MRNQALNDRQLNFAIEYRVDRNATQAAIRAGYNPNSAEVTGCKLLRHPKVREKINELDARSQQKVGVTADRVIDEIRRMAFYDISEFLLERAVDGKPDFYKLTDPVELKQLDENVRRAIVGYKWDKDGNFIIQLADKSKALDQLARHLSLYNDKVEVKVTDELADRVRRARERAS